MQRVGVLALQGDFAAHGAALERAGALPVYVRDRAQFGEIDGLIIPGGESTTMLKIFELEGIGAAIKKFAAQGKPIYGTCAGAILLAKEGT